MRVVVAMSGGVDSSVAAARLVQEGHEVIGLSMQLYDQQHGERRFGGCCSIDDLQDARRVAATLGIPHYILNFEQAFAETVVSRFVGEYAAGRTPSPCVQCNGELKFSHLVDRAAGLGAERVATGHYARLVPAAEGAPARLCRGADPDKDQSYFLFTLTQAQLARAQFPVGTLTKTEVRDLARRLGLGVADKADSQELCFVPDGNTAALVESLAPGTARPGPIRDQRGVTVGRHGGVHRYTVGQRRGLGLATSVPLYVLELDAGRNTVTVGPRAALERTRFTAAGVSWIAGAPPAPGTATTVRIRHRHPDVPARIAPVARDRVEVTFAEPQLAVAPGQAAVFYRRDEVLGGGWIE